MKSIRPVLAICVVLFSSTLGISKSSKLVISWKNPKFASPPKVHRVLALGLSDRTAVRANFEDALAAQLKEAGLDAIPGNTILLRPESTTLDMNYLKTQIRDNQIEGVIVARLIKVENNVTYIPGQAYAVPYPYYYSFYGYYGAVYPTVYSPGYLQKEKVVRIETNYYLTTGPDGELVWTGITDTFNPSNVQKAINKLVKVLGKQMQKDGVL